MCRVVLSRSPDPYFLTLIFPLFLTKTGVDNYGNPVYTIDEDKLSNFTRLTKGQNAALKEVVQGSGKFEVRSDIFSLGLKKGNIITVKTYKVNRKESPLSGN